MRYGVRTLSQIYKMIQERCMSCSGIDEDYSISGLPPIPTHNQVVNWNGKEVQVLDPSHSLIGKGVTIPVIPDHTDDTSFFQRFFTDLTHPGFYQRSFTDLTHAEFDDDEEEELAFSESDLEWAQALAFIGSNYSEDLTVEEILARRGMEFDKQFGQFSQCKSIWKRIGHGFKKVGHTIEKGCRKGAKKTVEFVKEHKKEILIGTAIVLAAAAIGLGAAALLSAGAAGESALNDSSPRRREEDDVPSPSASGPDPKEPSPPSPPEQPLQNNNGNKIQQFFDNLIHPAPTPEPRYSIYKSKETENHKNEESAPTPAPTPSHQSETPAHPSSTPPQQTSGNNKIQQFFDNVFKPLQPPHTNVNIHKTEGSNKEESAHSSEAAPTSPQVEAPASSAPSPFRSAFGAYLQDLLRKAIDADYQPASNQSNVIETVKSKDSTTPTDATAATPSSSNILGNIVEGIQQGLATIGQGMIDTELLNPNTPLDIFNDAYPQPSKISAPRPIIGAIDGKKLDEKPHIPVMLFTAVTLPTPPHVGVIPVLCPNGKLDWIVVSADWKKFQFSHEELKNGIFNLDAHLGEFIPQMGEQISIVTSQNGINVKIDEFVENCQADTLKIASAMYSKVPRDCPNLPLYVGIYNPTYGLIKNLNRVSQERKEIEKEIELPVVHIPIIDTAKQFMPSFNFGDLIKVINEGRGLKKNTDTPIVITTRNLMTAIASEAKKINSDVLWLDLRHSEAGLIYCRAFEGMDEETQKFLHKQLLSVALGPAESVSNDMAKIADNIFSKKDHITKRFSEALMNNPNYNIRVIACISPRSEFSLYIADHARAGTTYDTALEKAIKDLQREYKFNGKADE